MSKIAGAFFSCGQRKVQGDIKCRVELSWSDIPGHHLGA